MSCRESKRTSDSRHEPAAKIVANVRADIDDITDRQLLRLGEHHFHIDVPRRA